MVGTWLHRISSTILLAVLVLVPGSTPLTGVGAAAGASEGDYAWVHSELGQHQSFHAGRGGWTTGVNDSYRDGQTVPIRVMIHSTPGAKLRFDVCLEHRVGGSYGFAGRAGAVTGAGASIDGVTSLGLGGGQCPGGYLAWSVRITMVQADAVISYGGKLADGASSARGTFKSQVKGPRSAKTLPYKAQQPPPPPPPPPTSTPTTTVPPGSTTTTVPPGSTTTTVPPGPTTTTVPPGPTSTTTVPPGPTTTTVPPGPTTTVPPRPTTRTTGTTAPTTAATTAGATTTTSATEPTVPTNRRPVVREPASVRGAQGHGIDVNVDDFVFDLDGELDHASVSIASQPAFGAATVRGGGVIRYEPDPAFFGEDRFTFEICDDGGACVRVAMRVLIARGPGDGICPIEAAQVESFTVEPPEGRPGTEVVMDLQVSTDISDCIAPYIQFRFGGTDFGDPAKLKPNPGAVAAAVIPDGAAVGMHVIEATVVGDGGTLAEIMFDVLAAPPTGQGTGGGFPWWVILALIAALLVVAAALLLAWRRHDYRHPRLRDHAGDVCGAVRQSLADAEVSARSARSIAEEAAAEAASAQSEVDVLSLDLARLRRAGGQDPAAMEVGLHASGNGHAAAGFHLLDHANPNAPRRDDGRLGWFHPGRLAYVSSVVVHTTRSLPATADSDTLGVAQAYAKATDPSSVHALAGPDGVVELLPDDYTAFHAEGANRASLGLELVLTGHEAEDVAAVEQGAAWLAEKARIHGIPLRRIDREAFLGGHAGIIGHQELVPVRDDPGDAFPWGVLLDLATRADGPPLLVATGLGASRSQFGDRCEELATKLQEAMARARDTAERAAAARDRLAEIGALLTAKSEALLACEARVPADQLPEAPEAEPDSDSGWYLLDNENRHAAPRENGKRGHYNSTRGLPIRGIMIHAGESRSAVAIADYYAGVANPASAHVAVDPDGWINLLPDEMEAFHARHSNQQALAMVMAYTAADWGTDPATEEATMRLAAMWCAQKAREYGIPIRRITAEEWKAGEGGLMAHSDIDPGSGSDPGDGFDWDAFLAMVEEAPPAA